MSVSPPVDTGKLRDGTEGRSAPQAQRTRLRTDVGAVTLYADCAMVVRTGRIRLAPGVHVLEVTGLPTVLDSASISAALRGAARGVLHSMQVRYGHNTALREIHTLEAQIEALEGNLERVDHSMVVLRSDRRALRKVVGGSLAHAEEADDAQTPIVVGNVDRLTMLDTLRERAEQINVALQQAIAERRQLLVDIERCRQQLDTLLHHQESEGWVVVLEVETARSGDLYVDLAYVVSRAGWVPAYEMTLSRTGDRLLLRVDYRAEVRQATDEDWCGVAVRLSTARPVLTSGLAELEPWMIGPSYGPSTTRESGEVEDEPVPEAVNGASCVEAPDPASVEVVMTNTAMAEIAYDLGETLTIPSGTKVHIVSIARLEFVPEVSYIAVPKRSGEVFRQIHIHNDSPHALLAGKADLFVENAFVGTRVMDLVRPGDTFSLLMGVEEQIEVERVLLRCVEDRKPMSGRRRVHCGYEVRVRNRLDAPVVVIVHDQIPVAGAEGIRIRLMAADPLPAARSEFGVLRWDLPVGAGEENLVRFAFTVDYPRDMRLSGLPESG